VHKRYAPEVDVNKTGNEANNGKLKPNEVNERVDRIFWILC
jgi:hypothetical protein